MEHITLGQIQQIIVFLATFLTSGGVILAFALKIGKKILNKEIKEIFESDIKPLCIKLQEDVAIVKKDNTKIHEELKKNSLDTMRIAICSNELPLRERVDIGKRYIDDGGNGAVKVIVHKLEKDYENELKKKYII